MQRVNAHGALRLARLPRVTADTVNPEVKGVAVKIWASLAWLQ